MTNVALSAGAKPILGRTVPAAGFADIPIHPLNVTNASPVAVRTGIGTRGSGGRLPAPMGSTQSRTALGSML